MQLSRRPVIEEDSPSVRSANEWKSNQACASLFRTVEKRRRPVGKINLVVSLMAIRGSVGDEEMKEDANVGPVWDVPWRRIRVCLGLLVRFPFTVGEWEGDTSGLVISKTMSCVTIQTRVLWGSDEKRKIRTSVHQ